MLIGLDTIFKYFQESDAARAEDPGATRTIRRAPLDYMQGVDFEDTAIESLLSYEKYTETFQLYLEYQSLFKHMLFYKDKMCSYLSKERKSYIHRGEDEDAAVSDALYQHLDLKRTQSRNMCLLINVNEFLGHIHELKGREFLRDVSDYLKYNLQDIAKRNRSFHFPKLGEDAAECYMYGFPFFEDVKHRCVFKDFAMQYNAATNSGKNLSIEKVCQVAFSKMQPVTLNGYNMLDFQNLEPVTQKIPAGNDACSSQHWSDTYFDMAYRTIRSLQTTITGRVTSRLEW